MKTLGGMKMNVWIWLGAILLTATLTTCITVVTPSSDTTEENHNDTALLFPVDNGTMYINEAENRDRVPIEETNNSFVVVLVLGSSFLIIFFIIFIAVLYRYHRRKTAEYQRAARIHVASTRNAGIYMDLAMDSPMSKSGLPIGAPIYNSLKKHPNQYTFVSDDELDL